MVRIIQDVISGKQDMMIMLGEEEFKYKMMIFIGIIVFLVGMVM